MLRLEFKLELSSSEISRHTIRNKFLGGNVTDWMDEAVKKVKDSVSDQRVQDERFNNEQSLKKRLGAQYWADLRKWVTENVAAFNTKFGSEVISIKQNAGENFVLAGTFSSKNKTAVTVSFDAVSINLSIKDAKNTTRGIRTSFRLVGDTHVEVQLAGQATGQSYDVEEFGKYLFQELIG
jgi:hypothetical protein